MTDTERLDWIDEPLILPKVMGFWFSTRGNSIREVIDNFAKEEERRDQQEKDLPLEF